MEQISIQFLWIELSMYAYSNSFSASMKIMVTWWWGRSRNPPYKSFILQISSYAHTIRPMQVLPKASFRPSLVEIVQDLSSFAELHTCANHRSLRKEHKNVPTFWDRDQDTTLEETLKSSKIQVVFSSICWDNQYCRKKTGTWKLYENNLWWLTNLPTFVLHL